MRANTKLTKEQKVDRKAWKAELLTMDGYLCQSNDGRVTIAALDEFPGSSMLLLSVSVASWHETKLRRKVGEYHALRRLYQDSEFVKISREVDLHAVAEAFASNIWNE